jgi:hypothetical protein
MRVRRQANQYREHAEELRVIASSAKDTFNRSILLTMADDYERMARVRENIATESVCRYESADEVGY